MRVWNPTTHEGIGNTSKLVRSPNFHKAYRPLCLSERMGDIHNYLMNVQNGKIVWVKQNIKN
jgi:hypothetical protein